MDEWRRKQWERYEVLRYLNSEFGYLEYARDRTEDFVKARINADLLEECKRLGYTIDENAKSGVGGYHILRIDDDNKRIGVQCQGKDKCLVCIDSDMRDMGYRADDFDDRKERDFASELVPTDLDAIDPDYHSSVLWTHFSAIVAKNKGKRKSFDELYPSSEEDEDAKERKRKRIAQFNEIMLKDHASASTDMQSSTDPVPVQPKEPGPDPPTSPVQSQQ